MKADIVTEIAFSFPNEVGILAAAARAFADADISVEGMSNHSKGSTTDTYMVLSEGMEKAKDILTEAGVESIGEGNIVAVELESRMGAIADMAERLRDAEVNISNMYVSEAREGTSVVYISTNDDDKAVSVLNG